MTPNTVGIVGGGLMGAGIATRFAMAGYSVIVCEADERRIPQILPMAQEIMSELIDAGRITWLSSLGCLGRVAVTTDLTRLKQAEIVVEAIPEHLELKRELYDRLEVLLAPDALIASNTSGLLPDALCARMTGKARFLNAHFWNPPHLLPLVEVVPGACTSQDAVDRMLAALHAIAAEPVVLKAAIPGFIGNRIQFAVLREALHIVRSGAADPDTVDAVMKASLGRRYAIAGPFESADQGGLQTFLTIASQLMPELSKDEDVLDLLRRHTENGQLGAASGQGFYSWDEQRRGRLRDKRRQQLIRNKSGIRQA